MGTSKGSANWEGSLKEGHGSMKPGHAPEVGFSLASRFEGAPRSNPEELIGAALSGCFSMALTASLEKAGLAPERVDTQASVQLDKQGEGFTITSIALSTSAVVPGADPDKFRAIAEETKKNCPVGKALAAVNITLEAHLAPKA